MFGYANLTNLEQLTLDTQSVIYFKTMFNNTIFPSDRDIINLADFNTSKATTFGSMFQGADNIPTKDFSK
jgi:hypothetical protein